LSTDQVVILQALCPGESNDNNNIRKKLWPILQSIYLGEKITGESTREQRQLAYELMILGKAGVVPESKRISDSDLAALINEIREKLELPVSPVSREDINRLRAQPTHKTAEKTKSAQRH
jgi:hypothetical protein